jgi:hypothetical protein
MLVATIIHAVSAALIVVAAKAGVAASESTHVIASERNEAVIGVSPRFNVWNARTGARSTICCASALAVVRWRRS